MTFHSSPATLIGPAQAYLEQSPPLQKKMND